jgi:hypothetical protein
MDWEERPMKSAIERRIFLKRTALGSLALGSLPALAAWLPAWAEEEREEHSGFFLAAVSAAGPPPSASAPQNRVLLTGSGQIADSEVRGGGSFVHFLFPGSDPPPGGEPLPVVTTGRWRATKLVRFDPMGDYGSLQAGIAEIDIAVRMQSHRTALDGRIRIVSNISAAGLSTGATEGFTVTVFDTPFDPYGEFGPFRPIQPTVGLTLFARGGS